MSRDRYTEHRDPDIDDRLAEIEGEFIGIVERVERHLEGIETADDVDEARFHARQARQLVAGRIDPRHTRERETPSVDENGLIPDGGQRRGPSRCPDCGHDPHGDPDEFTSGGGWNAGRFVDDRGGTIVQVEELACPVCGEVVFSRELSRSEPDRDRDLRPDGGSLEIEPAIPMDTPTEEIIDRLDEAFEEDQYNRLRGNLEAAADHAAIALDEIDVHEQYHAWGDVHTALARLERALDALGKPDEGGEGS